MTALELMPVAEFPGRHGWGYDGVYISAAHSAYGGPQGLAAFVDAAHAAGLAVLLDVVYNHVGASGAAALEAFGPYFTEKHHDGVGARRSTSTTPTATPSASGRCRAPSSGCATSTSTACGWTRSTRSWTPGAEHLVAAVSRRVHAITPNAIVIAESGLNDPKVIRPPELGGWGCDAAWADDFHHALRVLTTGETEGWYARVRLARHAGQGPAPAPTSTTAATPTFRRRRFGAPAEDRPPQQFVVFAQNHDQVGNRAYGDRLPEPARRAGRVLHAAGTVHPDAVHGRGARRAGAVPVLLRPHRRGDRRGHPRGAPRASSPRSRPSARRSPTRRTPRPSSAPSSRARGTPSCAISTAGCSSCAASCRHGEAADIAYDEHSGWLSARRGPYLLVANFADARVHVPCEEPGEIVLATHRPTVEPGYVVLGPLSGAVLR